jgi:hypothetical protein
MPAPQVFNMTDEDKRKYIEDIFRYCTVDTILVINKHGLLQRFEPQQSVRN